MPQVFQGPTWSLELPDGWSAEPQPDHVEIQLPFEGARLRITPYRDETGQLSAADWLQVTEDLNRRRGRPVVPRRCGEFDGYKTHFEALGNWIRGWALCRGEHGLDVDYRCAVADAGRDDASIDAALSTLRLQRAAT